MIPGLQYYEHVIDFDWEKRIVGFLDSQPWNTTLKRRTQHYGYEYNYRARGATKPTTPIHGVLLDIANGLSSKGTIKPEQCIVNEYFIDQGISAHTDAKSFGPVIVSISLLEPCNMIFTKGDQKITLTLAPRSMLIFSGEARTEWKHEIPSTKTVIMTDGSIYQKPPEYRRISLTYRTMAQ